MVMVKVFATMTLAGLCKNVLSKVIYITHTNLHNSDFTEKYIELVYIMGD